MAPTKEKAKPKKAQGDDAENVILKYLRQQNRPYSATDVSANLHNKVTKTAAAKILKDLQERKEIIGRASGKQLVYHVIQDPADAMTPEELVKMDAEIVATQEETASLKTKQAALKSKLSSLNSTLSTADLYEAVLKLQREQAELTVRLQKLKGGDVRPISAKEKEKVEIELRKWTRVEKVRRDIVKDMWAMVKDLATQNGKDVEELKEDLGISL